MIVLLMEVHVKAERRAEFIELIRYVAEASERDEEGCLRFDVLEDSADENRFYFYDVYRDEAARLNHRTTEHYRRYAEETKDIYDQPTIAHWTKNLHPTTEHWR